MWLQYSISDRTLQRKCPIMVIRMNEGNCQPCLWHAMKNVNRDESARSVYKVQAIGFHIAKLSKVEKKKF